MFPFRFAAGAVLFSFLVLRAEVRSQEPKQPDDKKATIDLLQRLEAEYQQFFAKPEKVPEFWAAMKFEMRVGKFDLAAKHLELLLKKEPPEEVDKELVKIENAEGLSAFLRLQLVKKWSDHPPFQKEAEKNVETLVNRITSALEKHLSDPDRIGKFIKQLDAPTVEERAYAFAQLNRSRARAVPYLVQGLQQLVGQPLHAHIVAVMTKLEPDVVPAFLEALKARTAKDAAAPDLRLTLLDIIKKRGDTRAVPYLWHLFGSERYPFEVRARAKATLAYLLNSDPNVLPPPALALTELAEKYQQHKVKFADPKRVKVWPWNGQKLAIAPVTLTTAQAEEYFGLRHAREALELDPAYKPAQMVFLNLTLDHSFAPELDKVFLTKMPASLKHLLATIDADLLTSVLERALVEHNVRIALAALEVLGERGEVRSARLSINGPPQGIVKALYYPDRRVQFAAARAMLRMPAAPVPVASHRIVDILRRFLAADVAPKVLIAFVPPAQANQLRSTVKGAGYEPVVAGSIKDAMEKLHATADFDAIVLPAAGAGNELPYALTQLRGDHDVGRLPLLVLADKKGQEHLPRILAGSRNVWLLPDIVGTLPDEMKTEIEKSIKAAGGAKLSAKERTEFARVSLDLLWRMARDEVRGYDVRPALDAVLVALRSKDLAVEAIEILGRLPGNANQQRLAFLALDPALGKLRLTAARELKRHIQKYGVVLDRVQIKGLTAAYNNAKEDVELRSQLALVVGSLRPSAQQTGVRLYEFQPGAPEPKKGP